MEEENRKSLMKYYIRDFLLWVFLIFFIIFISNLSLKYIVIKHILVLLMCCIVFYRMFFLKNLYVYNIPVVNIKEIALLCIIIVQIYNNTYTNYLYNNYFGYLLFINIILMSVLPFFDKNYNLIIQLIILAIFTPIYYGYYQNSNSNNKYLWDITYISIFITVCIFEHSIRYWTLFALLSMIPMLINYNNNPFLYRLIGLCIQLMLYNDNFGLFYAQNIDSNFLFIKNIDKKIINYHYLPNIVYKYNNWKTNKLYYVLIIINYILLYSCYIFIKKNNIKTFIT